MSIPHFCRNSLFWTILVKICSLRCTANCSVLYGELLKITFVLYGSLLGRLEYKVQKAWNWANTGSPLEQYVFMKIPIIELFKLALDMLIWHLSFCFFQKSYLRLEGKIQTESTSQSGHDFRSWRCYKRCGTHKTVSQVRWKQDTTFVPHKRLGLDLI